MTPELLQESIEYATRFIILAKAVPRETISKEEFIKAGKASAACRRASMDLTRSLAELRKP